MGRFAKIKNAELLLLIVAIVWGSGFPINKIANDLGFATFTVLAGRFILATIVLSILFWKHLKTINKVTTTKGIWIGLLLLLAFGLQTFGLVYTSASKNAFIVQLIVVVVPFISFIFYHKKLSKYIYIASFIAILGVYMLSLNDQLLVELNIGDLFTLISVVFSSIYLIESNRVMEKHHIHPIPFSIIQFGTVGLSALILALIFDTIPPLSLSTWWPIIFLGLFNTAFGYLGQNIALKYVEPAKISIIVSLEAVFASVLEIILLSAIFKPFVFIGGGLIIMAVVVSQVNSNLQNKELAFHGKEGI
jgi:drug/metabolite transporter (DMT)-like permease